MKLLFSESKSDYPHYIFPYAVWAFPEPGETPADFFRLGFLPSSRNLDRFYLCRQIRVELKRFRLSSENRRILRKGEGVRFALIPRAEFNFSAARREFCKRYADGRFGQDVMGWERLDALLGSPITSDVLLFTDSATGAEVGLVTLYCDRPRLVYYYYGFYDLAYYQRSLGLYLMTSAVELFAGLGVEHLYLGSCYIPNALSKTQFAGVQFFNGVRWSENLEELKFLIRREADPIHQHLLESEEFRREFYGGDLGPLVAETPFRLQPP